MWRCRGSCARHLRHFHISEDTAIWETGICWHCQQARWSHCLETIWSEFSLCQHHQHISSKSYYENCVCFSPLNKLKQSYPECKFAISLNYAFRLEWNPIKTDKLCLKTYLCHVTSQTMLQNARGAFNPAPTAPGGCANLQWGHCRHLTHHLQNGEFSPDIAAKRNQYIQCAL